MFIDTSIVKESADSLAWLLDVLAMCDQRLAEIDGPDLVYSEMHKLGIMKATSNLIELKKALNGGVPPIDARRRMPQ